MSNSNLFNIGYGNSTSVVRDGNILSIDLYYGDLHFTTDLVNDIVANWGNGDVLGLVDTNGVGVWFDNDDSNNVTFNAYDMDDCGVTWTRDDFVKYLG